MPITLIHQKPDFIKRVNHPEKLAISEMFVDTIQGEGVFTGHPATFIRLQGCTLRCTWCDTLDVWPYGNEYSIEEVLELLAPHVLKYTLGNQHIVLTGGSPLKQQYELIKFLRQFKDRFGFGPFIEVENETVLYPSPNFIPWVSCWNNSPKLSNSGMKHNARVKPQVLAFMNDLPNSWFKFVISDPGDWMEIEKDFLPHISKNKIILMPEGQTQLELLENRDKVAQIAVEQQVRFSDRLHITIWDRKTGV